MVIELKEDVSVAVTGTGGFHTFPKGTYVNYSCRKDIHASHKFTADSGKHGVLVYIEVTQLNGRPSWL